MTNFLAPRIMEGQRRNSDVLATPDATLEPMMRSTLNLRRLSRADWRTLRSVRLAALAESPLAFMSRLEDEERRTDAEWQGTFDAATWTVAEEPSGVIGLTRSVRPVVPATVRYLESIWVAPAHRRRGVFSAILESIAETERRWGATELLLWVLEDNHPARRTYEAVGFRPTGLRQFVPGLGRFEHEMRLPIAAAPH